MQIEFHGILELWQWFTLPECAMDHLCTNSAVQTAALAWSLTHPCQITQNWKANLAPPLPDGSHTWLPSCLYLKGSAGLSVCLIKTMCTGLKDELSPCSAVRGVFPCNASLAWCTKQKQKKKKKPKTKSRNSTSPIFQVQPARTQLFPQEEMPSGRGPDYPQYQIISWTQPLRAHTHTRA